ncbi:MULTISPECIES: HNH endonuclease signature motif containing protein [unclassified Kribbella]|uniref:HNH endonuclease signature motif containing protein n=1 Tax=unclassified Kribbella TaxID=2644121 RepID=UPI0030165A94
MEYLDERPVWSMSGAEMLAALDALQAEHTRIQVRRLELLAALEAIGHAKEIGARDTVHLLSIRHRLDTTEVRRDLRLATALPKYPAVRAALDTETPLNQAQAEAIVSALEKVPPSAMVPVENLQVAEEELVKAAGVLTPKDLRTLGKQFRDRLDPDGPEPGPDDALAREELWLKNADDGVKFGGYLAGENAELLRTLIFAGAKPHKALDGERDPRGRGKRQADALTAILNAAAGTGTAVPGHGDIKPHITVTIDLEDLRTAGGTGDLVHGDSLSAAAVRRLACDAGVIPMVLGSNSEPLDVGTEQRFVTRAMRQALNARDKGCIICGAPPAMCEAHHIIHWADGGATALDNLALLCKRDHIEVHHGHYTVQILNGRPTVTRPTWADPNPPQPPRPTHPSQKAPPPRPHAPTDIPSPGPDWLTPINLHPPTNTPTRTPPIHPTTTHS